jgi:hypothetical protein
MLRIEAPKCPQTLPSLTLSLYRQLSPIPRVMEIDFVGNLATKSGKALRSILLYAQESSFPQ